MKESPPKKKVLVLSLRKRSGGCPLYSREIMKHFPADSYDLLAAEGSQLEFPHDNVIWVKTYGGMLSFVLGLFTRVPWNFFKFWGRIKRDYDALYIPYDALWNVLFVFIFKLQKKKIICTVHDAIRHEGERTYIMQTTENYVHRAADHLIFLTRDQEQVYFSHFDQNTPSAVIPHGIFEMEGTQPRPVGDEVNILFLGRIVRYKGVELLVEAAIAASKSFHALKIAGMPNYDLEQVEHPQVSYVARFLDDDEIVAFLNETDILVLPYLEASQSGVITLGIHSEIPMICSRVNGLAEQLDENEGLFVEPGSLVALSEAIAKLSSDKDERNRLKQALADKKKTLSWEKISKQVMSIIRKTTDGLTIASE